MKAAEEGHVGMLQAILMRGARLEEGNRKWRTALSFAAAPSQPRPSHPNAVCVLLEAGADSQVGDRTGRTPRQHLLTEQPEKYAETLAVLDEFHSPEPGKSAPSRLAIWKRTPGGMGEQKHPGRKWTEHQSGRDTSRPRRGDARREREGSRAIPKTGVETNIKVLRVRRLEAADKREAELYAAAFPRTQEAKRARQAVNPWQHHPQPPLQPQQQQGPTATSAAVSETGAAASKNGWIAGAREV